MLKPFQTIANSYKSYTRDYCNTDEASFVMSLHIQANQGIPLAPNNYPSNPLDPCTVFESTLMVQKRITDTESKERKISRMRSPLIH